MRRQEFIDDVFSWYDLYDFCMEYCEWLFEEYISDDYLEEYIENEVRNYWIDEGIQSLKEFLNNTPDVGDAEFYYVGNGDIEACGDYDFDDIKDRALEYMDDNGYWDEEEEEENEAEEYEIADEEFSLGELFNTVKNQINNIQRIKTTDDDEAMALAMLLA